MREMIFVGSLEEPAEYRNTNPDTCNGCGEEFDLDDAMYDDEGNVYCPLCEVPELCPECGAEVNDCECGVSDGL